MKITDRKKIKKSILSLTLTATITIIIVAALRVLLFASFRVPSFSMAPTLISGDFILVNKLVLGPRIDFLGNHQDSGRPIRLAGYGAVKRNDVLVFNDPYYRSKKRIVQNWNAYYVKRCVGIPGDTLAIQAWAYTINGNPRDMPFASGTEEIKQPIMQAAAYAPSMFKPVGWTIFNFGPIYIPRQGDEVKLDSINIHLYRRLIEYETGKPVSITEPATFSLAGQALRSYRFKQNYYFMAGDHAVDSKDSRYWGLLPEDHIVGKVAYIWKSKDPNTNSYRFDRFFKAVE